MNLIAKSRFGIHDLSRNQSNRAGEKARFNMPFELGLDMGSKRFGGKRFSQKKILILDTKPHVYDQYIGDISGQDIEAHENTPEVLIQKLRDWFSRINPKQKIAGASKIFTAYDQFNQFLPNLLADDFTVSEVENLQMNDYVEYAKSWLMKLKQSS